MKCTIDRTCMFHCIPAAANIEMSKPATFHGHTQSLQNTIFGYSVLTSNGKECLDRIYQIWIRGI